MATVFVYSGPNGTGDVGIPIVKELIFDGGAPPKIESIQQTRDTSVQNDIRVDFQILLSDPFNRGGTLRVWTNKDGRASANRNGSPDATYTVATTPATVTQFSTPATGTAALASVLGNAQEDKLVFFEFTNAIGLKDAREAKVTTRYVAIDETGRLTQGGVT